MASINKKLHREYAEDCQPFEYDSLQDNTIRLINILPQSTPRDIHCTIESRSDYYDDSVHYTALSYCWGSNEDQRIITLNGHQVKVNNNLWHAFSAIVSHHRHIGSKLYWVDALCIDQSNIKERNHQVHQMWRIFTGADEVFAWIGIADEFTSDAYTMITEIANSCTSGRNDHCPGWKKYHSRTGSEETLNRLMSREYFNRTWVIQEFVQARKLWLLCGQYRAEGSELFHLQKLCSGLQAGELLHNRYLHGPGLRAKEILQDPPEVISWLANTLFSYSRSNCLDPRDRLYAFLGDPTVRKLDPMMKFEPDYDLDLQELALVFADYCDTIFLDWYDNRYTGERIEWQDLAHSIVPQLDRIPHSIAQSLRVPRHVYFFTESFRMLLKWNVDDHGDDIVTLPSGVEVNASGLIVRRMVQREPSSHAPVSRPSSAPPPLERHPSWSSTETARLHRRRSGKEMNAWARMPVRTHDDGKMKRLCPVSFSGRFSADANSHVFTISRGSEESFNSRSSLETSRQERGLASDGPNHAPDSKYRRTWIEPSNPLGCDSKRATEHHHNLSIAAWFTRARHVPYRRCSTPSKWAYISSASGTSQEAQQIGKNMRLLQSGPQPMRRGADILTRYFPDVPSDQPVTDIWPSTYEHPYKTGKILHRTLRKTIDVRNILVPHECLRELLIDVLAFQMTRSHALIVDFQAVLQRRASEQQLRQLARHIEIITAEINHLQDMTDTRPSIKGTLSIAFAHCVMSLYETMTNPRKLSEADAIMHLFDHEEFRPIR